MTVVALLLTSSLVLGGSANAAGLPSHLISLCLFSGIVLVAMYEWVKYGRAYVDYAVISKR